MERTPFIGTGHNPDGPDLPLGLGMLLAQDSKAMDAFGRMPDVKKQAMIAYIQGAATGDEARRRVAGAVRRLHGGHADF